MKILAIDTATAVLSLALKTETDSWYFEADAGLRHSELVMDGIDLLMGKAGLRPADLSGVACMGGPGSFTGLRIGFSLAKGLAFALGIPFVPVPTLDCVAYPFAAWPALALPAIDAKKNAFFCALYRDGRRLGQALDAEPAEIAAAIRAALCSGESTPNPRLYPVLLTGPGAEQLYERLRPECAAFLPGDALRPVTVPQGGYARSLLDLAQQELSFRDIAKKHQISNNNERYYFSGPEYIRKSDAELQRGGVFANGFENP